MTDNQRKNLGDVTGSIIAGMMLLESLRNLVPNGMWLYLLYLVLGTVIITNKLNRIIRNTQEIDGQAEHAEWHYANQDK